MPVKLQRKVLDFVTRLAHTMPPQKKDGERLAKLAGLMSHEDAGELIEIINADCEQIDNEREAPYRRMISGLPLMQNIMN